MKRLLYRSIVVITLIVFLITSFVSCYQIQSDSENDYRIFCEQVKSIAPHLYDFLPKEEYEKYIVSSYWYYSDRDLFDSSYTIYLVCDYEEDLYEKEYNRLLEHFENGVGGIDVAEFNYRNITIQNFISYDALFDMISIDSIYALFDSNLKQVVYVAAFAEDDYSHVLNIPEKYLPNNFLELVEKQNNH